MKRLPSGWPQTENGKSIGFFAQSALEMVHPISWESYKLQTLSPLWRLNELRKVANSVIRGIVPTKVLDPMLNEANRSFCSDPVCCEILSKKDITATDLAISKEDKAPDILTQCGFLLNVCYGSYRSTAEYLVVTECFDKRRKSEIYLILGNYLSELVLEGQSRASIELIIRETFFDAVPKKFDRNLLRRFFSKFPKKNHTFRVYGQADRKLVETIKRIIPIKAISGKSIPKMVASLETKRPGEAYFFIDSESRDFHTAVVRSGRLLGVGEAVLMLFPGEHTGKFPDHMYAAKKGTSTYNKAPTKPQFSKRVLSHSKHSAFRHMDRVRSLIVNDRNRPESIVGTDFLRAIMTANLADNSPAPEVKLLTLWAAFEALLPLVPEGANNRISHFLEYIVPAVCLSYVRENFVEFCRDAERLHNSAFTKFLKTILGDRIPVDKLAAIIINGDPVQQRGLCVVFEKNPLALYRLMNLKQKFSTAEEFEKTMKLHSERVEWQVQRIYRERNTVMHNGESSPFVEQLLSNTYYYYLLTFTNIETVSKSYNGVTIPQSLSAIRKLSQADQTKVKRARSLTKERPIEAQAILLELVSGHFRSDD